MKLTSEEIVVKVEKVHTLELTHEELHWLILICGQICGGGKIRKFTDEIYYSYRDAGFKYEDMHESGIIKDGSFIQVKEV